MGLAIKEIISWKEIGIADLKNKTLAVDSYNLLYQFLTTIRGADGSLLTDSKGNVTSHLVGLFSRITNLMQQDLKLIFVFDGKPPKLKAEERERRKELKITAEKEYKIAKERKDLSEMKKQAARTTRLTPQMVNDSQELLNYLGLPVVKAPCEGEAQAAYIVKQNDAFACVSQDFDSLLYEATRIVRNLSVAGRRKMAGKLGYVKISPEIIVYTDVLENLNLNREQLIALSMLVGTDYNVGGIKGIGPKNALKLVRQHKDNYGTLFKEVKWCEYFDFEWKEVFELIKNMPVDKRYSIGFAKPNFSKIKSFLCDKHDFDEKRVENTLEKLGKAVDAGQKGLGEFVQ